MTVNTVEQDVPGMVTQSEELLSSRKRIQEKGIDVRERLDKLRQSIQKTRELANKIKVGIDFDPSTTIELKNPDDLIASATATKVIKFIKNCCILLFSSFQQILHEGQGALYLHHINDINDLFSISHSLLT